MTRLNSTSDSDPLHAESKSVVERWTWGLFIALALWGAYLALGTFRASATLSQGSQRGIIVLGCSMAFLTLWSMVISVARRRNERELPSPRNWLCLSAAVSGFIALSAMLSAALRIVTPEQDPYRAVLAVSLLLLAISGLLSVIGLSDVTRPTWKWMGLAALMLIGATLLAGLAVPAMS